MEEEWIYAHMPQLGNGAIESADDYTTSVEEIHEHITIILMDSLVQDDKDKAE